MLFCDKKLLVPTYTTMIRQEGVRRPLLNDHGSRCEAHFPGISNIPPIIEPGKKMIFRTHSQKENRKEGLMTGLLGH